MLKLKYFRTLSLRVFSLDKPNCVQNETRYESFDVRRLSIPLTETLGLKRQTFRYCRVLYRKQPGRERIQRQRPQRRHRPEQDRGRKNKTYKW